MDQFPTRADLLRLYAELMETKRHFSACESTERRRVWRGRVWLFLDVVAIVCMLRWAIEATTPIEGFSAGVGTASWFYSFIITWMNFEGRWSRYCKLRDELPEKLRALERFMELEQEGNGNGHHTGNVSGS